MDRIDEIIKERREARKQKQEANRAESFDQEQELALEQELGLPADELDTDSQDQERLESVREPEPPPPEPAKIGRKPPGTDTVTEFLWSLDQVGSGNKVEVMRAKRSGGPMELIYHRDTEYFDLEELRQTYGGGKYKFQVRDREGAYLFQRTLDIAGKAKQPAIRETDNESPRNKSTLQLIEALTRRVEQIADDVRHHPQEAQGKNAFELAIALAEHTRASTQPYLDALLARSNSGNSGSDMVEILLKGIELARDLNPPADPMVPVMTQLAVPLLSQLTGQGQMQPTPAPNPPPQPRQAPDSARPPWDVMLTPWIPNLQKWASRGKDPSMRALFVLDELPDDIIQIFGEQVERGEAFLAEFFQLHPETRTFEPWYREFWETLAESLEWTDPSQEADDLDDSELEAEQAQIDSKRS